MRFIVPLFVLSVFVLGCGDSRLAEVSGTVKLDGQLIEEGSIQFIPVEGNTGAGSGDVIKDGKYHIARERGVAVGKNRVEFRAFKESKRMVQDPTGKPGTKTFERLPAFPPTFNDASTIIRDIQSGSQVIDFDFRVGETPR